MRSIIIFLLLAILGCQTSTHYPAQETNEEFNNRMEWWREARFGMFIHWGLYAVPAGQWGNSTNHAEWIRTTAQIPLETYDQFLDQFNPTEYHPEDWVKMAKSAGMKYIVITSKHHDGFCLWDSRYTDFDIGSTPYQKDLLEPLAEACKREGIKLCFYHSIMDWHHPDYLPRRNWETERSTEGADFDQYIQYMKKQLKELLTNYGDIGVLWFDGEWENTWTSDYGEDLYQYVRSLQPNILVNNRVSVGRSGMEGMTEDGQFAGDFGTPEQQIPDTGIPGVDWETCMTMNNHWGYNKLDQDFKSSKDLLQKLADIASKGGNFLLNIGPKADGTFPKESIERLRDIGHWMDANSESIYGTTASPFNNIPWGRCTQKAMAQSTRLFLHVFDWPQDNKLLLEGIVNEPIRAFILSDEDEDELPIRKTAGGIEISVPYNEPDMYNSVIVLDVVGSPQVYEAPLALTESIKFVNSQKISFETPDNPAQIRYTVNGEIPDNTSSLYSQPIEVFKTATIQAATFIDNQRISPVTSLTLFKVNPGEGMIVEKPKSGLIVKSYAGKWAQLPDFNSERVLSEIISNDFALANNPVDEDFGLIYSGYIKIESTDLYRFFLSSDDGSRLYIGQKLLIDNDGLHSENEKYEDLALAKGFHPIRIEYFERSGGNALKLQWKSTNNPKQEVNPELFFH